MEEILERIASEIYEKSYVVVDDLVDEIFRKDLLDEQTDLMESGRFRRRLLEQGKISRSDLKSVVTRCYGWSLIV